MSATDQHREHLVAARLELFEADLAFAQGDVRAARIHLDLAQAYIAETRKGLDQPKSATS